MGTPPAPAGDSSRAHNTRAEVGKSSSTHRGDPDFAHVLPQPSCPGSASTGQAASQWPHEASGLGILFLPLPTGGRSHLRRERVGWGGQGAGSCGPRLGVCRADAAGSKARLQGHCGPGLRGSKGARWAPGQVQGHPLSHPPQPSSSARYGSQAAQACLGPVAGGNFLGRGGGPHFLFHKAEEDTGGTETTGHPQNKKGRGRWPRGSKELAQPRRGFPPRPFWSLSLTGMQSSPWLGDPRTGGEGGKSRVSEPCREGRPLWQGRAGQGRKGVWAAGSSSLSSQDSRPGPKLTSCQ